MDKHIQDSLKIWYEERCKEWPEQPPFDRLTIEQKAMWAKSISFTFWLVRQTALSVLVEPFKRIASFLKKTLNDR